jgi:hypothetical protein
MSDLRDQFAIAVLPSLVLAAINGTVDDFSAAAVATSAYAYADAMLKAREEAFAKADKWSKLNRERRNEHERRKQVNPY